MSTASLQVVQLSYRHRQSPVDGPICGRGSRQARRHGFRPRSPHPLSTPLARGICLGCMGLSSGAGRYWSRRKSRGSPPPGTQRTIDTALESSRWGERSFVETKSSFEVVRARDAGADLESQRQPPRWLMIGPSDLFDVAQRADAAAEALRRTPHRARTAAASARHA